MVARDRRPGTTRDAFQLVEKLPVNYNIGHLVTAEGDTVSPDGQWLVALNKWSIDRFPPLGTLHPQNFQLVDLTGDQMQILYDAPIGMGEPHYVQMIKADKLVQHDPGVRAGHRPDDVREVGVRDRGRARSGSSATARTCTSTCRSLRSHYTPDIDPGEGRRHAPAAPDERGADAGRDPRVRDPRGTTSRRRSTRARS